MGKLKPYFASQGIRLIGIGTDREGFDEFVAGGFFKEGDALYIDGSKQIYRALGCAENTCCTGCWGIFHGSIMPLYSKSRSLGFANNMAGDKAQLGGTFAFRAGGEEAYAFFQSTRQMECDHVALCHSLGVELPAGYDPYAGLGDM